jgi:flagellar hook assembly protein FlgD
MTCIQVFDMRGLLVRTLLQQILTAGRYQVSGDGKDQHGRSVSSGVYVFCLVTAEVAQTRKAVLVR